MITRCLIAFALTLTIAIGQEPTPPAAPEAAATPEPTPGPATTMDKVVLAPTFWQETIQDLAPALSSLRFSWTSTAKEEAQSVSPSLSFGGQKVDRAVFRFTDQKPTSVVLFFYDRGLSKEINARLFDEQVEKVQKAVTDVVGQSPQKRQPDPGSVVRTEGLEWILGGTQVVLEWSAKKTSSTGGPFRAEFIRMTVQPKVTQQRAIGDTTSGTYMNRAAVKKFSGPEHVVRADGDVKILDVPMVDQGSRGYCVVASVERVMRYYGATVDQSDLAQIANSDANQGTNPTEMVASLNKLTGRLGVRVRSLERWDVQGFVRMLDDYNRAAKRAKLELVPVGGVSLDECYQKMDPTLYRQLRLKKAGDESKFQSDIQRSIDTGIPLLWSVSLGMAPESEIKGYKGGHMRLIIGYNAAKNEIIYSDSWGPGHEQKRMPLDDAWVITAGLDSLQPIGS
jgi:Peptidase_C39 like family